MRTKHYTPEFVESFPTPLKAGVLYVSLEYRTCAHLCACGCGNEAVTPLSPAQWSFTYDGVSISVRPSVGNWALACQSHYVIEKGRVRWARHFPEAQIAANRARDQAALDIGSNAMHPAGATSDKRTAGRLHAGSDRRRDPVTRLKRWLQRR